MVQILTPAGMVPAGSVTFGPIGGEAIGVAPGAPLPTYTPGGLAVFSGSLTRPADTTAYASGDLIANSVAAGGVLPVELVDVARAAGEAVRIERVRLRKSGPVLVGATYRVHFFRRAPVVTAGDNAVFDNGAGLLSLADIAGYVGSADVVMDKAAAVGAIGIALVAGGGGITCEPGGVAGKERYLWALIEARGAYTPLSGETFTVTIEGARS